MQIDNPINSAFRFFTNRFFSEHATRDKIARSGHIALSVVSITLYAIVFGVKPLYEWSVYKLFDGPKPEMSWGVAVAAAIFLVFVHLFTRPEAREAAGISFLRFVHLAYDVPSRLCLFVVKRRTPFTVMGVLLIFSGLAVVPLAYQNINSVKAINDKYENLIVGLKRFVERRRVSENSAQFLAPLVTDFCDITTSKVKPAVPQDPSLRTFVIELATLFQVSGSCLESSKEEDKELQVDFAQRVADSASTLEGYECPKSAHLCGYMDAWSAKLHLILSQEGRILDHTRRAHELFLKAELELKSIGESSGVVENGLSNVYAQYIRNYPVLSRDFDWPDIIRPPRPFVNATGGHPSFVAVLNQALAHLEEAKRVESKKDAVYARGRFENNLDDICFRLILLRNEAYVNISQSGDPLAGAAAVIGDRIDALRSDPLALVRKAKSELSKKLIGSDIAAVPVTIAQLGALEMDLQSESVNVRQSTPPLPSSVESLTPVEAIQVALFMGYRDRGFFEHPHYMGMCPVVTSETFGRRYTEIVQKFLAIEPERLLVDCEPYQKKAVENGHGRRAS